MLRGSGGAGTEGNFIDPRPQGTATLIRVRATARVPGRAFRRSRRPTCSPTIARIEGGGVKGATGESGQALTAVGRSLISYAAARENFTARFIRAKDIYLPEQGTGG